MTSRTGESLTAIISYWYSKEQMRMDGGGIRIAAWEQALTNLGYRVKICGLWTIGGGVAPGGRLSKVKRALLPMPLTRSLPEGAEDADLVIATVPATFKSALERVPHEKLILDWMDLWSVAARNMGRDAISSRPGGWAQSLVWRQREQSWTRSQATNVYAGFDDFEKMAILAGGKSAWLPTPMLYLPSDPSPSSRTRPRIGFIGNMDYPPNRSSLRKFLSEYCESIEKSGWELVVAGFGSEIVKTWNPRITVLGEIGDVETFYRDIDAAVVPVDHGGGIKVKSVEALAHGIPVFATDHVRSGYSPEFRPYLLGLDTLHNLRSIPKLPSVPEAAFSARFGFQSFEDSLAGLVRK